MNLSEFDYELPPDLIAQRPLKERDASRMLVVDRKSQSWVDSEISAIPNLLQPSDVVVVNNTRVFPARLSGTREPSGGEVEVLLVRELEPFRWEVLVRPSGRLKRGALLRFGNGELIAEMLDDPGSELRTLKFRAHEALDVMLEQLGHTPLPPYIKRNENEWPEDRERYQTVFASQRGAIAAPTAGLHFTEALLKKIQLTGAEIVEITLHVGYGTFAPIRVNDLHMHEVAAEDFTITELAAEKINARRSVGGRILSVGTTTTRALESAAANDGTIEPRNDSAKLTITPGYRFRAADVLLTNFHLPQSSLLLLAAAFAGRELLLEAYRHAVTKRYRFYSYGDCMLIV
jgi:S-adenosylmethionine:tRNA ribosyltransferase-isomerase